MNKAKVGQHLHILIIFFCNPYNTRSFSLCLNKSQPITPSSSEIQLAFVFNVDFLSFSQEENFKLFFLLLFMRKIISIISPKILLFYCDTNASSSLSERIILEKKRKMGKGKTGSPNRNVVCLLSSRFLLSIISHSTCLLL